jgi:uncharacterized protein
LLQIAVASCQPAPVKDSVRGATRSIKSFPESVGYVNDFEKIFTTEQALYLDRKLADFENFTKIQIALVTLDSSLTSKEEFENYTLALARKWGVGRKEINDGMLIGISRSLRNIRIQNGYGIEKILTDKETKRFLDSLFIPAFKQGDFYGGTARGINAIIKTLTERRQKLTL